MPCLGLGSYTAILRNIYPHFGPVNTDWDTPGTLYVKYDMLTLIDRCLRALALSYRDIQHVCTTVIYFFPRPWSLIAMRLITRSKPVRASLNCETYGLCPRLNCPSSLYVNRGLMIVGCGFFPFVDLWSTDVFQGEKILSNISG